jgi:hypothetical protein
MWTRDEIRAWAVVAATGVCTDSPGKWLSDEDKVEFLEEVINVLANKCAELEHYALSKQTSVMRPDSATECAPIAGHPAL